MRLTEFKTYTTDPQTLLNKIKDDIVKAERVDCHGQCATAIRQGDADDNDIVVILGPKGAKGNIGFHSVIINGQGDIKVDSFSDKLVKYDKEQGIFYYDTGSKEPMAMISKKYALVRRLKTM